MTDVTSGCEPDTGPEITAEGGSEGTRERILANARELFARNGFDKTSIRAVATGGRYLDASITGPVIGTYAKQVASPGPEPTTPLSPRETEVLRLIAWGNTNKEIAARLDLSVKTVEAHKANGMRKLGMRGRIDIVRYALLQGWLHES